MERKVRGLTLEEAIIRLRLHLDEMRLEERGQLDKIDVDTAFEKGYEICLTELEMLTRKENK